MRNLSYRYQVFEKVRSGQIQPERRPDYIFISNTLIGLIPINIIMETWILHFVICFNIITIVSGKLQIKSYSPLVDTKS